MALEEDVGVVVNYKAYTSGDMTLAEDTISGSSGGQTLRRTTSTLALSKSIYSSAEVNSHRQVQDLRHGGRSVGGAINGELSPRTFQDLMEAAMRGTWAAAVTRSNTEFTSCAADNTAGTLTVGGSTWAAQGFFVGDVIRLTNMSNAANNNVNFIITALSGTVATVTPKPTTQTADTTFNVVRVGRKLIIPTSGHVRRKFAFEHNYTANDMSHLFTECRITGMQMNLPAEGLATVSFPVLGRNRQTYLAGAAPFFTSPAVATTTDLLAAVNGTLRLAGSNIGVVTGLSFNLDLGGQNVQVVGSSLTPDVFLNRSVLTGQMTGLFDGNALDDLFANETVTELQVLMNTTSAADSPFMNIYMGRVKVNGSDIQLGGSGPIPLTLPFQALLRPAATGYDNTTFFVRDSESA